MSSDPLDMQIRSRPLAHRRWRPHHKSELKIVETLSTCGRRYLDADIVVIIHLVHHYYMITTIEQLLSAMTPNEAATSCHQNGLNSRLRSHSSEKSEEPENEKEGPEVS